MDKRILTQAECFRAAQRLRTDYFANHQPLLNERLRLYGVPRGGIPVAYLVEPNGLVETPEQAMLIVDDIIDSGKTRDRYLARLPETTFLALADYLEPKRRKGQWLVFPWEVGGKDESATDIVTRLLQYVGEDPTREGLRETPDRVMKAWKEWTSGYELDASKVFKCFLDGGEKYDEMVVVKDLPFYSHCEHHLAPFFGTATIAYLPDQRVVGLSKLGRVLNVYAKRLQVQERLTVQVADAIQDNLKPKGVGVLVKARHLCMESRGLATQGHITITSALRGIFLESNVRQEFFTIAHQ